MGLAVESREMDDTMQLWTQYRQTHSKELRNKLVMIYEPIVKKIAFKMYRSLRYYDSPDELVSEGLIALINAIDRFDLDRNVKFETFVSRRIQGAMMDYINKQNGYQRRIHESMKTISKMKEEACEEFGHEPSHEELAAYMGISVDELEKKMQEAQPVKMVSLDQMVMDAEMKERPMEISSGEKDDPGRIMDESELSDTLVKYIKKLNEEQQLVLSLFYKEELTIQEISGIMNTNSKRVSQIRFQAIKKLKKLMGDKLYI